MFTIIDNLPPPVITLTNQIDIHYHRTVYLRPADALPAHSIAIRTSNVTECSIRLKKITVNLLRFGTDVS